MQRQIYYNMEMLQKKYFSPYTDIVRINSFKLLLCRRDTGKKVVIECSKESALDNIINALLEGVLENELIEMLGSKQLALICELNGVIE